MVRGMIESNFLTESATGQRPTGTPGSANAHTRGGPDNSHAELSHGLLARECRLLRRAWVQAGDHACEAGQGSGLWGQEHDPDQAHF